MKTSKEFFERLQNDGDFAREIGEKASSTSREQGVPLFCKWWEKARYS